MKLFLVRHAEGEDVIENWQTPQTHLSSKGKIQAEVLGKLPRFKVIDKIITSDWKRTKETAEIVAKTLNKPVKVVGGIEERHQSSRIYGLSRIDPIAKQYSEEAMQNRNNWGWKWDIEEESFNDVVLRSQAFKEYAIKKYSQKSILVFSHETFIRLFIATCIFGENWGDDYFRRFYRSLTIEVTGISLLVYREDHKVWKLWYLNDYSHLGFVKAAR